MISDTIFYSIHRYIKATGRSSLIPIDITPAIRHYVVSIKITEEFEKYPEATLTLQVGHNIQEVSANVRSASGIDTEILAKPEFLAKVNESAIKQTSISFLIDLYSTISIDVGINKHVSDLTDDQSLDFTNAAGDVDNRRTHIFGLVTDINTSYNQEGVEIEYIIKDFAYVLDQEPIESSIVVVDKDTVLKEFFKHSGNKSLEKDAATSSIVTYYLKTRTPTSEKDLLSFKEVEALLRQIQVEKTIKTDSNSKINDASFTRNRRLYETSIYVIPKDFEGSPLHQAKIINISNGRYIFLDEDSTNPLPNGSFIKNLSNSSGEIILSLKDTVITQGFVSRVVGYEVNNLGFFNVGDTIAFYGNNTWKDFQSNKISLEDLSIKKLFLQIYNESTGRTFINTGTRRLGRRIATRLILLSQDAGKEKVTYKDPTGAEKTKKRNLSDNNYVSLFDAIDFFVSDAPENFYAMDYGDAESLVYLASVRLAEKEFLINNETLWVWLQRMATTFGCYCYVGYGISNTEAISMPTEDRFSIIPKLFFESRLSFINKIVHTPIMTRLFYYPYGLTTKEYEYLQNRYFQGHEVGIHLLTADCKLRPRNKRNFYKVPGTTAPIEKPKSDIQRPFGDLVLQICELTTAGDHSGQKQAVSIRLSHIYAMLERFFIWYIDKFVNKNFAAKLVNALNVGREVTDQDRRSLNDSLLTEIQGAAHLRNTPLQSFNDAYTKFGYLPLFQKFPSDEQLSDKGRPRGKFKNAVTKQFDEIATYMNNNKPVESKGGLVKGADYTKDVADRIKIKLESLIATITEARKFFFNGEMIDPNFEILNNDIGVILSILRQTIGTTKIRDNEKVTDKQGQLDQFTQRKEFKLKDGPLAELIKYLQEVSGTIVLADEFQTDIEKSNPDSPIIKQLRAAKKDNIIMIYQLALFAPTFYDIVERVEKGTEKKEEQTIELKIVSGDIFTGDLNTERGFDIDRIKTLAKASGFQHIETNLTNGKALFFLVDLSGIDDSSAKVEFVQILGALVEVRKRLNALAPFLNSAKDRAVGDSLINNNFSVGELNTEDGFLRKNYYQLDLIDQSSTTNNKVYGLIYDVANKNFNDVNKITLGGNQLLDVLLNSSPLNSFFYLMLNRFKIKDFLNNPNILLGASNVICDALQIHRRGKVEDIEGEPHSYTNAAGTTTQTTQLVDNSKDKIPADSIAQRFKSIITTSLTGKGANFSNRLLGAISYMQGLSNLNTSDYPNLGEISRYYATAGIYLNYYYQYGRIDRSFFGQSAQEQLNNYIDKVSAFQLAYEKFKQSKQADIEKGGLARNNTSDFDNRAIRTIIERHAKEGLSIPKGKKGSAKEGRFEFQSPNELRKIMGAFLADPEFIKVAGTNLDPTIITEHMRFLGSLMNISCGSSEILTEFLNGFLIRSKIAQGTTAKGGETNTELINPFIIAVEKLIEEGHDINVKIKEKGIEANKLFLAELDTIRSEFPPEDLAYNNFVKKLRDFNLSIGVDPLLKKVDDQFPRGPYEEEPSNFKPVASLKDALKEFLDEPKTRDLELKDRNTSYRITFYPKRDADGKFLNDIAAISISDNTNAAIMGQDEFGNPVNRLVNVTHPRDVQELVAKILAGERVSQTEREKAALRRAAIIVYGSPENQAGQIGQ